MSPAQPPTRTRQRARCHWVVLALGAALACSGGPASESRGAAWVEIRDARVDVEVMRSASEQAQGLSGRPRLEWGDGMLFPYAQPQPLRFWMKDMRFDIDIVWIRAERIVDISHRVPRPQPGAPDSAVPTAQPRELADLVLEVPAGFASSNGWRRGDRVTVHTP